jgi:hypothetical protein
MPGIEPGHGETVGFSIRTGTNEVQESGAMETPASRPAIPPGKRRRES